MTKQIRYIALLTLAALIGCSGSKDTAEINQETETSDRAAQTSTDALISYQDAITQDFLRSHLTPFAADSMEGRETGTEGQEKAAQYLADQYKKLGMQPVGDNNTYYQKFDLNAQRTDSVVYMTYKVNEDGSEDVSESVSSQETIGNYIRQYGNSDTIDGEIAFVGYGIQDQSIGINHLKGADLKGKWVMILGGEVPQVIDGDTLYTDQRQFLRNRYQNLIQQGIAGILTIPDMDMEEFKKEASGNAQSFGELTNMQLKYLAHQNSGPSWGLSMISPEQAAKVLGSMRGMDGLNDMRDEVLKNIKSFNANDTGYGFTQVPYVSDVTIETENVVAYMEGADPQLKDEVVVLSAHYDHVGIGEPDSTGDAIYNGANDDGSGTIGVLSAAKAFANARENGVSPKRSVLFLSVTGEEKGLLGSRYYSDHPIFPIEKTVANINTDMIGRVDPEHREKDITDYVYIIGGDIISSELSNLIAQANGRAGELELDMRYNDLNDPNQFYRRSDHWNFGRFGVPFVFFFNGVHEDYHQPSDEVDKMNWDLYAKTARSMYASTVMVANAESAPRVDNQEFIEITKED